MSDSNITDSFDVPLVLEAVAWLRAAVGDRLAAARAATGGVWQLVDAIPGSGPWGIQADYAHAHEAIASWGADGGGIERRENGAHIEANAPGRIIADAEFHLGLLNLHTPQQQNILRWVDDGWRSVPFVTCSHCDLGDPYQTVWMGYPCATINHLFHAHRHLPGYRPQYAPLPATPPPGAPDER
ncbi:hypothetical protein GCM10017673_39040 [Streptosporangium violaceochromogenes]|nr:hypothetical protein GCM10017673_39040 [Streptosporangium violaceochromogenes]